MPRPRVKDVPAASVRSILIIRLSAIGDVVMATPLIRALRARYPHARIAWLAEPQVQDLLAAHPLLDEVIAWPRGEWARLWRDKRYLDVLRAVRGLRARLKALQPDLTLDLQGLLKSGLWAWLSGAKERIGLGSREGSRLLMTRVLPRAGDPERIGSEYLFLAQTLGLPVDNFEMDVALTQEDESFARQFIGSHDLERGYAALCPFTTRPQKHWFEERWVGLLPRLREELGLAAVLLGGPADREAAERLTRACGGRLADAVGHTRLRQAAALIKHARLLIGVDTGLTHMGIAFHVPTIALFGSTHPYGDTTQDNAVVLYHKLPCSPCRRNPTCNGAFTCMLSITEDEVIATAKGVLSGQRSLGVDARDSGSWRG
jgi:heptosyltransferase I